MIPQEALEAAVKAWDHYWGDRYGDEALEEMGDEVRIALEAAAPFLRAQALAEVVPLIHSLTDLDTCWFDHHGGCQAHGYLSLQPGETCPQHDAKEFVKAHGVKDDDASKS